MSKFSQWLKKYFVPHKGNDYKPHFWRHESMFAFFLFIIIIELGFLVQVFIVFDKTNFLASVLPGVLATLTNEERAQNNAAPLTESTLLDKAAQEKAEDMAKNGYFAHTSPDGKTPWYWFQHVGYKYIYAGENLAVNFFESDDVAQAWMNSPTHRQNIVKQDYTEIGIGVATGTYQGRSTVFVAQLFGTPLVFPSLRPQNSTPTPTQVPTKQTPVTPKPKTTPGSTSTPKPKSTSTPLPLEKTVPVVVPSSATTQPAPIVVKVLGEETTSSQAPVQSVENQSVIKTFIQNALSSPRQSTNYIYGSIALLITFALLFMLFIKSEIHHPPVLARGLALMAIILILSFVNLRVLNIQTEVPTDGNNITANAIQAVP